VPAERTVTSVSVPARVVTEIPAEGSAPEVPLPGVIVMYRGGGDGEGLADAFAWAPLPADLTVVVPLVHDAAASASATMAAIQAIFLAMPLILDTFPATTGPNVEFRGFGGFR
jgi:hypothetical protein